MHFHLALYQPEIPQNTGAIGRTATATGCHLHIIHPIGFNMDERARRRAGLDYWDHLAYSEHADWAAFVRDHAPRRLWLFTTKGEGQLWDADFRPGDTLLFGQESAGVPQQVHDWVVDTYGPEARINIPMRSVARSLNLANTVCAATYEGLRQLRTRGELLLS